MSKIKKAILLVTTYALIAALAVGGTLAYLQDSDSDVNVMTLGNVSIEQIEQERDENGNLVDFTQAKPAYPVVGPIEWAAEGVDVNGTEYKVFTDELKNVVDKIVTVENTGESDAYIRTIVAIEAPDGDPNDLIHINWNGTDVTLDGGFTTKINGVDYAIFTFTYNEALAANEVSAPSLMQVFLDSKTTNEDCALFGETWEILVLSQAVQTAGFADAKTALDTAFGAITTTNHPWSNTVIANEVAITEAGTYDLDGDIYAIDTGYIHTQNATGAVTVNGNGATINSTASSVDAFTWEGGTIPAMSPIFSSADGSTVTVNDLTFTGTMSAIMLGHYQNATYNNYNTVLNNVNVIGTEVVSFSANVAPAVCVYGTAALKNCNIYDTTLSPLDTDPMWPVYDLAAVNYSDVTVNDSKIGSIMMWNQAKVTIAAGSEVDTIVVRGNMNTTKYGLVIQAGAAVDVIDLSAITNKTKINITIEDGAVVGAIVANGVTYASIEEWQNA